MTVVHVQEAAPLRIDAIYRNTRDRWGRRLGNGDIGIVTIPHERMHQIDRFRDDFGA